MNLPGFTAEAALYTSRAVYASSAAGYGAANEHVIPSMIDRKTDRGSGYDPEKGWPREAMYVGPWNYADPGGSTSPWEYLGYFGLALLGAISGGLTQDCTSRGGTMIDDGGSYRCSIE